MRLEESTVMRVVRVTAGMREEEALEEETGTQTAADGDDRG